MAESPIDLVQQYYALCEQVSRTSVGKFLDRVVINCYPDPKPFGDVAEEWQKEIVGPKIAALEGMVGLRAYEGPRSFLTVLPRGHDKSSLEARFLAWGLCYSPRRIEAALCAADGDQAKLVLRAMRDEAELNPWYAGHLSIQSNKVIGPRGQVDVVPADAASAYGGRYNLIVMDEVTHWKNDKLWNAIVTGREKVPTSLLIAITNAGIKGTWQEKIYHTAKADPKEWVVFDRPGNHASWMTAERRAKVRELVPELEARRVLDNEWIDPAEATGYLFSHEVQACLDETITTIPPGAQMVMAVDYGAVRDRTAIAIVFLDEKGICRIPILEVIQGSHARPVEIAEVEKKIREYYRKFKCVKVFVDPHQMEGTIQALEKEAYPIERVQFRGGAFNCDIATNLRKLILNKRLRWHPTIGKDFAGELASLVTLITPHGYRFDHTSGRHDDQAFAVAVACLDAVGRPMVRPVVNVPSLESLHIPSASPHTLFGR